MGFTLYAQCKTQCAVFHHLHLDSQVMQLIENFNNVVFYNKRKVFGGDGNQGLIFFFNVTAWIIQCSEVTDQCAWQLRIYKGGNT